MKFKPPNISEKLVNFIIFKMSLGFSKAETGFICRIRLQILSEKGLHCAMKTVEVISLPCLSEWIDF